MESCHKTCNAYLKDTEHLITLALCIKPNCDVYDIHSFSYFLSAADKMSQRSFQEGKATKPYKSGAGCILSTMLLMLVPGDNMIHHITAQMETGH